MVCVHGKVIDVEFAPHPLELVELIGDEAAYDLFALHRHDGDDMLLPEQLLQISVRRWLTSVGLVLTEDIAEQYVQPAQERDIGGTEATNGGRCEGHGVRSGPFAAGVRS
jgi:hypothetical protein